MNKTVWHYCVMCDFNANQTKYNWTGVVDIEGRIDSAEWIDALTNKIKASLSERVGPITGLRLTNWILLKTEKVKMEIKDKDQSIIGRRKKTTKEKVKKGKDADT